MLKIHTNLSLRKTWLNTLARVARGQRSFAYEKILYLIGLKYAVSFLFLSKIETHTRLLREKTWLSFLAGVQGGRAPLPKKMFYFDKHKIHNLIPFLVKINNKNNHNNGNIFSLCHFFSNIISALPWGGARGTCMPPVPSPSYATEVGYCPCTL